MPAIAQDKDNAADRTAIEALGKRWQEMRNRHDIEALSELMAEDVDFVTVRGPHGLLEGRKQLQEDHARKHETSFKASVWTTKEIHTRVRRLP